MNASEQSTVSYFDHRQRLAARLRQGLVGLRQLTRCHVSLAARPELREAGRDLIGRMVDTLSFQLGTPVEVNARLLEVSALPAASLGNHHGFALLELAPLGSLAVMEVELGLLTALLGRLSGGSGQPTPASRLTRIEESAFAYLTLAAISACRATEFWHRLWGPRLLSVHADRGEVLKAVEGRGRHVAIEAQVKAGEASGVVRLLLPAHSLRRSLEQEIPLPSLELPPGVSAAGLHLVPRLGKTQLTSAELKGLCPGDVVMFPLTVRGGHLLGACRLLGPTFELTGHTRADGFHLSHARVSAHPEELTMTEKHSPTSQNIELPVEVEVELARLRLTVGELGSLRLGAVLPLHITAQDAVSLRVGDRVVAKAELVEIEGEIGARVLTLVP